MYISSGVVRHSPGVWNDMACYCCSVMRAYYSFMQMMAVCMYNRPWEKHQECFHPQYINPNPVMVCGAKTYNTFLLLEFVEVRLNRAMYVQNIVQLFLLPFLKWEAICHFMRIISTHMMPMLLNRLC